MKLAFSASFATAQMPVIPATPVEETKPPVFADFKPGDPTQIIEHKEPLSADGLRTDILASGFRAANGIAFRAVK